MKSNLAGKVFFSSLAALILLFYLYSNKLENEAIEEMKRPPTSSQVEDFFKDSGLNQIPKENFVYFFRGPDRTSRLYQFSQGKSDYYEVVIKLSPTEAKRFAENKIFSSQLVHDLPPSFAKEVPQITLIKNKSYLWLKGSSPRSEYINIRATIDDRGDFSYVYIDFSMPENFTPEP